MLLPRGLGLAARHGDHRVRPAPGRPHPDRAADLLAGPIRAVPYVDGRLPELYSGHAAQPGLGPVPYPAACAPQAWTAAAAPLALTVLLGLHVDLPAGTVRQQPPRHCLVGSLRMRGLRIGDREITASAG